MNQISQPEASQQNQSNQANQPKVALLIDQDSQHLQAMAQMFLSAGVQVQAAQNGQVALQVLSTNPSIFTAVYVDIMNPNLNGFLLLEGIKRVAPNLPVFVTSQENEILDTFISKFNDQIYDTAPKTQLSVEQIQSGITKALNGEPSPLKRKLELHTEDVPDMVSMSDMDEQVRLAVRSRLSQIQKGNLKIPTLPILGQRVKEIYSKNVVSDQVVNKLIELDQGLAYRVITSANNNRNHNSAMVYDLKTAMQNLGNSYVARLIYTVAMEELFIVKTPALRSLHEAIWNHSVAVGLAARQLAKRLYLGSPDKYYMIGFLHNIGAPFLLSICEEITTGKAQESEVILPKIAEEIELTHTKFSAALLDQMNLPNEVVDFSLHHHSPEKLAEMCQHNEVFRIMVLVLCYADRIARSNGNTYPNQIPITPPTGIRQDIKEKDLNSEMLQTISTQIKLELGNAISSFGINYGTGDIVR